MSSSLNKAIIIGNLGQDPEIRYTAAGKCVANFSIATSETWNDKQTGEKMEKTEWHRISAFGRAAEIIGEYATKGSKLYVEGQLETRKWTDKQGIERYSTGINLKEFKFLDKKGEATPQGQSQDVPPNGMGSPSFEDDIPF